MSLGNLSFPPILLEGVASDTKPTTWLAPGNITQDVPPRSSFIETDTGDEFYFNGTVWRQNKHNGAVYSVALDYNLEVLLGNVPGHSMVSVNGHNDDQTTTRITVAPTLTTSDIDQTGLHATAATVDMSSYDANDTSAGTGLRTVLLIGLDSDGNAQTETITLNGQTEVTSSKTYSAINNFRGLTAGSNNTSAGDIWVGNGTFTNGVPATKYFVGEKNHNKGLTAYYTVPTGHQLVIRRITATIVGTNKEVELTTEVSVNTTGVMWLIENELSFVSGGAFPAPVIVAPPVAAGKHVRLRAEAAGGGTELTAVLGCELVQDGF